MSTGVRQSPHEESKPKAFGFGYESKSDESPSVQTARAEFLNVIAEIKPEVVFSLFRTCYLPFTELLELNKDVIAATSREIDASILKDNYILRQPKFIRERALENLIPDYNSLEGIEGADPLFQALTGWGLEHNLLDGWCLDDALEALRTFEVADEKSMAIMLLPDYHYLVGVWSRSWRSAAIERRCLGLVRRFEVSAAVEKRDALVFRFKYEALEFEVFGPFSQSVASFKRQVEVEFKKVGGPTIRGARKQLDYQLRQFVMAVDRIKTELDLTAPPRWRKADDFFKWLLGYQLPPCKTYRQIAREVERDEKTVREGVRSAAFLIRLTLRSNEADKHSGRPKGAKDRAPRRRVDHRREKCGEMQTNIS